MVWSDMGLESALEKGALSLGEGISGPASGYSDSCASNKIAT